MSRKKGVRRRRRQRRRRFVLALLALTVVALTAAWPTLFGSNRAPTAERMETSSVAASAENSAWIERGRARVFGDNEYGQCDTRNWDDVVAVALGDAHAVGLTADGRLMFAGDDRFGQCQLTADGAKVVAIDASAQASYAVFEDGSVRMCGNGPVEPRQLEAARDVRAIAASDSHVVLLGRDGRARMLGGNAAMAHTVQQWTDLIAVDCGEGCTIALDAYGGVHVADTGAGQSALDGAQGARRVAAGGNFCLIAMRDGSVLGAGSNSRGQLDAAQWTDAQAIACGYMHAVGQTADGERLFAGDETHGQRG